MRVESPLADIDFVIGDMHRQGRHLIFKSGETSSLEATVRMDPGDAWKMVVAFFKSPSAIGFALSLPFLWLRNDNSDTSANKKSSDERHPFDALNDPW